MKNAVVCLSLLISPLIARAIEPAGVSGEALLKQAQSQFDGAGISNPEYYRVVGPGVVALPARIDDSQVLIHVNAKGQYEISGVRVIRPYKIVDRKAYVDNRTANDSIAAGLWGAIIGSIIVLPMVHMLTGSWLVAGAALFFTVAAGLTAGAILGNWLANRKPTYYEETSIEGVTLTAAH